jgi:hypothetical protein
MKLGIWTALARAFRRAAVPLVAYYAVTVALPVANGAARSGARFVDHALIVLVVPPVMIVLACAVEWIKTMARHTRSLPCETRFSLQASSLPRR